MQVVIIEDEVQVAQDILHQIQKIRPEIVVQAIIDSVESALDWFAKHSFPDLIFSDIQLGDGLSFEIFKKVKVPCPVIFCTAFDAYAIEAFKNNGVDYLLKPINQKDLMKSLEKIELFRKVLTREGDHLSVHKLLKEIEQNEKKYKSTFLMSYRDKLIPVESNDIRLLRIVNEVTYIFITSGKKYQITQTLDALEKQLDPRNFYRANRQNIVSFKAIKEVANDFDRRLKVSLTLNEVEPIVISKTKATDFISWLSER
jgi:DNA-binding LytR/AlgR family response regulator